MLLVLSFCLSAATVKADDLQSVIGAYNRTGYAIGVVVHDLKTGKELFGYNEKKPMNPASTMKIITSSAAFHYLSGSYKYETTLSTDQFSSGTISNLYLKGTGDPSLVEERLWRMAKDLRVRGVKKISGDIIIDNSYFDGGDFSGKDDSSSRAYNAELSALALNFNSFAVVAKNIGGSLQVHIDPPTDYFKLKSTIRGSGDSIAVSRTYKEGKEHVLANGGVSTEKIRYANVANPVLYAGTTLAWVLDQMGIEFSGKIRSGKAVGSKVLFKDSSKPLSLILRDLNKWSNNFTAEMVLKTLGAVKGGVPGSTEKGLVHVKAFLQKKNVPASEYQIYNGSGLSKRNRVSANVLNKVLMASYGDNKVRNDFIATMAIAGKDGTLRSRLKSPGLIGNVKAKTGTLNDVTALSGYIETKKKNMVAFTILVNGGGAGGGGFYAMQEKLLNKIYELY